MASISHLNPLAPPAGRSSNFDGLCLKCQPEVVSLYFSDELIEY